MKGQKSYPPKGAETVENFLAKGLVDEQRCSTFAPTSVAVMLAGGYGLPTHCITLITYLLPMNYHSYDLPSAVTEDALANMVCASVKDYLGGVTDYVERRSR